MRNLLYERSVFVNCPFDGEYRPLFQAIVFAVHDCGYAVRSALAVTDGSQVRIEKIGAMIGASRFGIHDISRTELDRATGLPRFNMPLELGLFLGAKRFGTGKQKQKNCLILDVDRYRFQKFISDIAGQDIASHSGQPAQAIRVVRDWLSDVHVDPLRIPGGALLMQRYEQFREELPALCAKVGTAEDHLTFNEYVLQVEEWLIDHSRIPS